MNGHQTRTRVADGVLLERRGWRALPARLLLGAVQHARRLWWATTRPLSRGSRAICLTPDGRLVLVRHSYMPGWFLPGGGPARGEDLACGLLRELREEVGLITHSPVRLLFNVEQRANHKRDLQAIFLVPDAVIRPRLSMEIEAVGAFSPDVLPPLHPSTRFKLSRWQDEMAGRQGEWPDTPVPPEP